MSRVAAKLGASTMSLYRYVAAKDELLALMLDAATGLPDLPPPDDGWRPALTRWAWGLRAALRRHPWAVHLPLRGPPITPNQIVWLEHGLRAVRDTRLTEADKLAVILLVSGYVWRESTLFIDIMSAHQSDNKWQQLLVDYGRTLAKLIDTDRFPAESAAIASGLFDTPDEDPDADFVFGLDRILDGIEVLVRSADAGG
jgi:AcrR family transcriptional regulator